MLETGLSFMEYAKGVCILIPTAKSIPAKFILSFGNAFSAALRMGMQANFAVSDLPQIDRGRQRLLSLAIEKPPLPEYLFWLDTDIVLEEGQAGKLLAFMEAHPEAGAVSGLYFKKLDYEPVCAKETGGELRPFMPEGNEPQEIDAAGMGCMVVRTQPVVERLLPLAGEAGAFVYGKNGEDAHFCSLMKKTGMRLFVLPEVSVLHLGGAVGRQHYEKLR